MRVPWIGRSGTGWLLLLALGSGLSLDAAVLPCEHAAPTWDVPLDGDAPGPGSLRDTAPLAASPVDARRLDVALRQHRIHHQRFEPPAPRDAPEHDPISARPPPA